MLWWGIGAYVLIGLFWSWTVRASQKRRGKAYKEEYAGAVVLFWPLLCVLMCYLVLGKLGGGEE